MKKLFTFFMFSALFFTGLNAQDDVTGETPLDITVVPGTCFGGIADCGDFVTEYFITSLGVAAVDGLGDEIIGTSQENNFTLYDAVANAEWDSLSTNVDDVYCGLNCQAFAVTPVCYDINAVRLLVDALNTSDVCCQAVNGIAAGVCEGIRELYPEADLVQSLDDVLGVIAAFGSPSLSVQQFEFIASQVNDQADLLMLFCPGTTALGYCVDVDDSVAYGLISGVNDLENFDNLTVSPNPVNDVLTINYTEEASEEVTISVVNTLGQEVSRKVVNAYQGENTFMQDMSAFDTGIYMVSITSNTKKAISKVMKR